ncbi:glycosyltransferase family 4 protein [bacterium]|nr:glycosyltransferase family 4 protein [bacterium]
MKIGIDCRSILNPEKGKGAGISHYVYQLVRNLLDIDKSNTYFLFFDRSVRKKTLNKFSLKNVKFKFFPFRKYGIFLSDFYSRILTSTFIDRENLDVFHVPSVIYSLNIKTPYLVTVHDLSFFKFPEWYVNKDKNSVDKEKYRVSQLLKEARYIISPSLSTAKDLESILGIKSNRIKIIPHGVDERFFQSSPLEKIAKIKKKYKLGENYFLFLGTLEERKNILRIISAFERFSKQLPVYKYNLCLAGSPGQGFSKIKKKIQSSPFKDRIILPGYIPADDIGLLFEGASAFVFPSLYEGFGLPLLEAMAKKVPVIAGNVSSLPEVAKGHSLLVDPYDISEITEALKKVVLNKDELKGLIDQSYEYAQGFSWLKTAKKTLELYKSIKS